LKNLHFLKFSTFYLWHDFEPRHRFFKKKIYYESCHKKIFKKNSKKKKVEHQKNQIDKNQIKKKDKIQIKKNRQVKKKCTFGT
jgi:hypothetical protein